MLAVHTRPRTALHVDIAATAIACGAYHPYIYNHCTPEQAVTMADAAGARLFAPIHHKTFRRALTEK